MRIVGGRLKGRSLLSPQGRTTRPTGERAREAAFNILAHAPWAGAIGGARVIDLFAGSGALGFEALSRGAAFCLFVETDAAARGAIRANAEALGLTGLCRVHRRDATAHGPKPAGLGASFDLAFLDPPYGQGLAEPALARLAQGGWLAPGALAMVETAAEEPIAPGPGYALCERRLYGAAAIAFLRWDGPAGVSA